MVKDRVEAHPDSTAFLVREEGQWRTITWRAWWEDALSAARGLNAYATIEAGDRVALMAGTGLPWMVWELAIAMLGAVSVPVDPSAPRREARMIVAHAGCVAAVVEHPDHLRTLSKMGADETEGALRCVVYMRDAVDLPEARGGGRINIDDVHALEADVRSAASVLAAGRSEDDRPLGWGARGLQDAWSIVYTSGTTGAPRGVVLTHKNLVYEAWAVKNSFAVDHRDVQLAFLPMHHIFARHMVWAAVASGASTALCEDPRELKAALTEVRPTYFGAVPWTFERMRTEVERAVEGRGIVARRQFRWAMRVARDLRAREREGRRIPPWLRARHGMAERLVLATIRAGLGGRVRFAISGAAPIRTDTLAFFHALGVLVLEGYGLTESTGATHVNRPNRYAFGAVGVPLPGCEASLAEDGEVLIRGHHVMRGYHEDPAATGRVIDEAGWLHTGDLGALDRGFLTIVGRKKDLIVTAAGKNVSPSPLQRALGDHPLIERAVVLGDGRPHLAALVVLDEIPCMARAKTQGLGCDTYHDLVCHPEVRAWIRAAIDQVNEGRTRAEQLRAFAILPTPLTRERGELTATLKVRRQAIIDAYADLIDAAYETAAQERRAGT